MNRISRDRSTRPPLSPPALAGCVWLALSTAVAAAGGYADTPGPYEIDVIDPLVIPGRDPGAELTLRISAPRDEGPFPVILFSHGFAAGRQAFEPIARHWASYGYVSIHPDHDDSRNQRGSGRNGFGSRGARRRGGGRLSSRLADRVRDLSAVIDALPGIEDQVPALAEKLDRGRIGVSGHSFGAATAMVLAGVTPDLGGVEASLADPRVEALLAFSAAGPGEYGLNEDSWDDLDAPTLYVTGTRDIRPGYDLAWRLEPYRLTPGEETYLAVFAGATHFDFGGGLPGRGLGNRYTPLVQDLSTAFWDAVLKERGQAEDYLRDGGFEATAGRMVTFRHK